MSIRPRKVSMQESTLIQCDQAVIIILVVGIDLSAIQPRYVPPNLQVGPLLGENFQRLTGYP